MRILPGEIIVNELGEASGDRHHFAPALDLHLALLGLLDGVFLGRPLIERIQILIDAGLDHQALADNLDAAWRRPGLLRLRVLRRGSAVPAVAVCTDGVSGSRICAGSPSEATTNFVGSGSAAVASATGFTSMNGFATSSAAAATSGVSGTTKPVAMACCGLICGLAVASMLAVSDGARRSTACATAAFSRRGEAVPVRLTNPQPAIIAAG